MGFGGGYSVVIDSSIGVEARIHPPPNPKTDLAPPQGESTPAALMANGLPLWIDPTGYVDSPQYKAMVMGRAGARVIRSGMKGLELFREKGGMKGLELLRDMGGDFITSAELCVRVKGVSEDTRKCIKETTRDFERQAIQESCNLLDCLSFGATVRQNPAAMQSRALARQHRSALQHVAVSAAYTYQGQGLSIAIIGHAKEWLGEIANESTDSRDDLDNNKLGRELGAKARRAELPPSELSAMIIRAYTDGEVRVPRTPDPQSISNQSTRH